MSEVPAVPVERDLARRAIQHLAWFGHRGTQFKLLRSSLGLDPARNQELAGVIDSHDAVRVNRHPSNGGIEVSLSARARLQARAALPDEVASACIRAMAEVAPPTVRNLRDEVVLGALAGHADGLLQPPPEVAGEAADMLAAFAHWHYAAGELDAAEQRLWQALDVSSARVGLEPAHDDLLDVLADLYLDAGRDDLAEDVQPQLTVTKAEVTETPAADRRHLAVVPDQDAVSSGRSL